MGTIEEDIIEAMVRGEWYGPPPPSTGDAATSHDDRQPGLNHSHRIDPPETDDIAPVVQAQLLRDLLMGNAMHRGIRQAPLAVRLRGVTIIGTLNLRDSCGTGEAAMPPLLLSRCRLVGNREDPLGWCIRADYAHLSRLSLRSCRVGRINLEHAKLSNELELVAITPADERRPCQIFARGIHVAGPILAKGTRLWIPEGHKLDDDPDVSGLALYLVGARVEGDVLLGPGFFAAGGVNLRRASISGAVLLEGDCVAEPGKIAFHADFLRCSGPVSLRFSEKLDLHEAWIALHPTKYFLRTVSLCSADIGELYVRNLPVASGQLRANDSSDPPGLDASSCSIRGNTWLTGIVESPSRHPRTGYGVEMIGAKVGGDLVLDRIKTSMRMQAAEVKGRFLSQKPSEMEPPDKNAYGLDAWGVKIGNDVDISGFKGSIFLAHARVHGRTDINAHGISALDASCAIFHGPVTLNGNVRSIQVTPIRLAGGKYEGRLTFRNLSFQQYVHAQQFLDASNVLVGHDLIIERLEANHIPRRLAPTTANEAGEGILRISSPSFYRDRKIVEALVSLEGSRTAIVSWLLNPESGDFTLLDGTSAPIHHTNELVGLKLDSPEMAIEYTRFFCFFVWGDSGSFRLIENNESCTRLDPSTGITALPARSLGEDTAGGWIIEATVHYDKAIFTARFLVKPDGTISMLNDEHAASARANGRISFEPPFRVLNHSLEDGDWFSPKDGGPLPGWMARGVRDSLARIRKQIDDGFVTGPESSRFEPGRLKLQLNGLKASAFCYDGEQTFGKGVQLDLDGFEYDRIAGRLTFAARDFDSFSTVKDDGSTPDQQLRLLPELRRILRERIRKFEAMAAKWVNRATTSMLALCRRLIHLLRNLSLATVRASMIRLLLGDVRSSIAAAVSRAWKWMFPLPRFTASVMPHHQLLRLQYADERHPLTEEYKPQPYEQLARVLRNHGMFGDARRVVLTKLSFERQLVHKWWAEPWQLFLEKGFKHGLFMGRGLVTFGLFWTIGALAFDVANHGKTARLLDSAPALSWITPSIDRPVLVLDALPVLETLPIHSVELIAPYPQPNLAVRATRDANGPQVEIRCGDQADPFLYALDVMIPILDLKQENRCGISGGDHARGWRVFKTLYAILGAIVTSIVILAVSGVLRRRVET